MAGRGAESTGRVPGVEGRAYVPSYVGSGQVSTVYGKTPPVLRSSSCCCNTPPPPVSPYLARLVQSERKASKCRRAASIRRRDRYSPLKKTFDLLPFAFPKSHTKNQTGHLNHCPVAASPSPLSTVSSADFFFLLFTPSTSNTSSAPRFRDVPLGPCNSLGAWYETLENVVGRSTSPGTLYRHRTAAATATATAAAAAAAAAAATAATTAAATAARPIRALAEWQPRDLAVSVE